VGAADVKAVTVVLREQIIATLRDRPAPITTDQVVVLAHPVGLCTSDTGECVSIYRPRCLGHCWKTRIYNSLRALERKGLVVCHRTPGHYAVAWSARPEPTDAEMNALLGE
jgi:hypothetical protein